MLLRQIAFAAGFACGLGTPVALRCHAEPAPAAPTREGLSPIDAAFDLRIDLLRGEKDKSAAFAYVAKEYARDPRPHVEARYAEFLTQGEPWGAPSGQESRGLALAIEARGKGSLHALSVLGWEAARGRYLPGNAALGPVFLRQAANTGSSDAMLLLGELYLQGIGIARDLKAAEVWFTRAAWQGKPHSLSRLAAVYEHTAPPDIEKAAALYYEAASRGSVGARKRLEELASADTPAGTRAYELFMLSYASLGADFTTKKVRAAVADLETKHPDDALVLVSIGRMYEANRYISSDMKKARACFERAMALGSDDARAEHARLFAEGWGVKKDPARAVATWRELAAKGNARALSLLGFYSYWGSLGADHLPKDAGQAFAYCVRAADLGDAFGQMNAGTCYEFGIGTAVDYAFAASYYRAAAERGERHSIEKLPKLLRFVLR